MNGFSGDSAEPSTSQKDRRLEALVADLAEARVSRRQFLVRAAALGLSVSAAGAVLAACGGEGPATTSASSTPLDTTLPSTLHLYNWADYTAPVVVSKFEKKYGVKVKQTYFDDNEALLSKLKAGARGYDLIVPSDYMVHVLMKTGLVQALHMEYLPNFRYVAERFQKPVYDNPDENGGRKYSIPYDWGTTGIGVRIDMVKEPITSWADLWNPRYKSQINMLNDQRELLMAALIMLGCKENCTNQAELDQATQKCIEQKPLVRAYDSINMKRAIISGVPLVQGWDGWLLMALPTLGPKRLQYVLPLEGYNIYQDCYCIPVGAPSPYAAHLLMNFLMDPKVAAETINYTWYHTPVPQAKAWVDKIVLSFEPNEEELKRGQQETDLGVFTEKWAEAWQKIKSA
jgi:spermidine/putrescine transport system substrate-binding protein